MSSILNVMRNTIMNRFGIYWYKYIKKYNIQLTNNIYYSRVIIKDKELNHGVFEFRTENG